MIYKFRITHWNCSKFANFIRGAKKPRALEYHQWEKWHEDAQSKHPLRYWMAEKLLTILQDIIMFPVDLFRHIKFYINNRFRYKSHIIETNLPKGEYHEIDEKILYGCFNELVKYVEIECAWVYGKVKENKPLYIFKNGSCKAAGLDYLDWAMKDKYKGKLTNFAKNCKEIKRLYLWWTTKRPNRKNPFLDKWAAEDDKMLSDLINIRRSLWI